MKLPVSWLTEYVDVAMPADKLADALTMSGSKVDGVETHGSDAVIEIEVTTNRPDCLSILGLAREVAAFTGRRVRVPAEYGAKEKPARTKLDLTIEDRKGCPRYTGRLIENVRVASAPQAARRFLELMGTRPVSNVVDVTNYVLFECGQPLHAFDFDKLSGGKIVVRRSRKGEKLLGIDGQTYELDGETLVIADAEKPVAIAGVIGGKFTEVTDSTKTVLLESAYFDPALVRRAARKYKISTESSYRFERRVNPDAVPAASRRAARLLADWAGGVDTSGLSDKNFLPKKTAGRIALRLSRLEALLGMKVSQKRAIAILKALDLDTKALGKNGVGVARTALREDLKGEHDLIEEILRIEGFEKIPAKLPPTNYPNHDAYEPKARVPELKRFLAASGFDEIVTYSLVSVKHITDSAMEPATFAKIANPASAEQEYLRRTLLPGFLQTIAYNANRKASSLRFFEIGKRYLPREKREERVLALAVYGSSEENWKRKDATSFFDLKGAVENALAFLGAGVPEWSPADSGPSFDAVAEARIDGAAVGFASVVSAEAQRRWDIPHEAFFAEIVLFDGFLSRRRETRVVPVAKFPSVRRDIAFVIEEGVPIAALERAIREAGAPFLREMHLFDQYVGKNIPSGKRSLAFSLAYQKDDGTFTDAEITGLQKRVGDALKDRFRVEFR